MTTEQRKKLLKAQQGELDAVILYKRLADAVKDPKKREQFKKVAADEGKHASILRQYTKKELTPKSGKAVLVVTLYRLIGEKRMMKMIANGERSSIGTYAPLVKDFPNIQIIMDDEERHAQIALSMIAR